MKEFVENLRKIEVAESKRGARSGLVQRKFRRTAAVWSLRCSILYSSACFSSASVILLCVALIGISCRRDQVESPNDSETSGKVLATNAITEADRYFVQREDLNKVRQGIALLRQVRVTDYGNYDVAWRLAKFNYYLGMHSPDERERDNAFREGIEAGKAAVQLKDAAPEGHFWLGANYGGSAEHSTLAGLANVEDIRREMEAVIQRDEGYQNGSAYLALGQLYQKAPRILGGDNQKAIEYLEKGLRFGTDNALLRLHLAEAYHAAGRDGEARKEAEYILRMRPDSNYLPEQKEAVAGANKLLEKIKGVGSRQ